MGSMMSAYAKSFQFPEGIVGMVTSELSQADAVRRSRDGQGPSIALRVEFGHPETAELATRKQNA